MPKVDSKGRLVLPQSVREQLEITPGTEVTVREEDGRVIVEPAEDPDAVIEQMERLIEETAADGETRSLGDAAPVAEKHREAVRRGAEDASDE
ncbi:AbrB/MazE/SpoVT family DNA-binding domain-containing protein [Halobacteriales archaeon QS_9_68_42]|nr:MAG: AbrB/MazE/SpoVT family DNA-binding domain-containing protein [Halobacteriales archaeon QS_1_68_44]PSQ41786.1 MAG: AbrB/MazE/SpoVT family DNA-binding domain-containing protein [Halobacteriales archaeon QS_9_68_42]